MFKQYREAGFRVFGLHYIREDKTCSCGHSDCEAVGKHPITSSWQQTPDWDDDQFEVMEWTDQFKTGFGVLCQGKIIVDVDQRNGGCEAFAQLCQDIGVDLLGDCQFAVKTGSGGGSMHLYFQAPEGISLVSGLKQYKGIDFKSSGFVVGAGSLHASGNHYEVIHGSPGRLDEAPDELIALLKRTGNFSTEYNGEGVEVTEQELIDMLGYISPDCDGPTWISIGMALHYATDGNGFHLWDDWSRGCPAKYAKAKNIESRWHSLGKSKSAKPITIGTLVHFAEQGGYRSGATFLGGAGSAKGDLLPLEGVDLKRPPGFVWDVVRWIDDQCLFPMPDAIVGAALASVGNICGLSHIGEGDETANLIITCVAGSGVGKDSVLKAINRLHRVAGIAPATHGAIKSEKEIYGNLIRHQACNFVIDELGIQLGKIINAGKNGSAYNEGTIGTIMSAFTKANDFLLLSGDMKEEVRSTLAQEMSRCMKAVDQNEDPSGSMQRRADRLKEQLGSIDNGLEKPFMSMLGFTTPETFDQLVTPEQVKNGFIARSMIFQDMETNPRIKPGFSRRPMPTSMEMQLRAMYRQGSYDMEQRRVEFTGERTVIRTEKAAMEMIEEVYERFHAYGELQKATTGYEAITRRAYEMVLKISLILAVPGGLRTREHVLWAYALVKRDVDGKISKALQNDTYTVLSEEQVRMSRIVSLLPDGRAESEGTIVNRCRKWKVEDVKATLALMEKQGRMERIEVIHPRNGSISHKWKLKE